MNGKAMIKAAILGGIVVFIWGFISWMVIPWHGMTMQKFQDEEEVASAIRDNAPTSGIYVLPNMCCHKKGASKDEIEKDRKKHEEMMHKGPFVFASIRANGVNGMTVPIVISLITEIVGAFFIALLLSFTKVTSYMKQVGFVTLVGLVIAILSCIPAWNWWGFGCGFTLVSMLDYVIGWFLGGLVIAKFAKHK